MRELSRDGRAADGAFSLGSVRGFARKFGGEFGDNTDCGTSFSMLY